MYNLANRIDFSFIFLPTKSFQRPQQACCATVLVVRNFNRIFLTQLFTVFFFLAFPFSFFLNHAACFVHIEYLKFNLIAALESMLRNVIITAYLSVAQFVVLPNIDEKISYLPILIG